MTNVTIANVSEVAASLATKLNTIRAEVEELLQRRESLMLTTQAELIAAGIPSYVIRKSKSYDVGSLGYLVEGFNIGYIHSNEPSMSTLHHPRNIGPYLNRGHLYTVHGIFEVLLIDGDKMLVAQTPDQGDTEAPHRKTLSRLRNLARTHDFRVSVRDREVTLIDPMNTHVHTGDALSAFKWIHGFIDSSRDA